MNTFGFVMKGTFGFSPAGNSISKENKVTSLCHLVRMIYKQKDTQHGN
ncbi:MAG: hypothetical protein AAF611_07135 [Bacteroidota bacterium]